MRILCCLDGTNAEALQQAVSRLVNGAERVVSLLYVIDQGPHDEMARVRGRFLRPQQLSPARQEGIRQADTLAAQDILHEGERYFAGAELLEREGRPEREIVNCAAEWQADLVILCPRSAGHTGQLLGPKSVGHIARFVLDHAPCPVLLVRSLTYGAFPLPR